jgi:hypothetical protein
MTINSMKRALGNVWIILGFFWYLFFPKEKYFVEQIWLGLVGFWVGIPDIH